MTLDSWRGKNNLLDDYSQILGIKTVDEEFAFEDLIKILDKYPNGKALDEVDKKIMQSAVSTILDGADIRRRHVINKGEKIYKSVVGAQEMIGNPPDSMTAIRAYTLFHQGNISIGNQDLKKIMNSEKFNPLNPPDGKRWYIDDLVFIYQQFGFKLPSGAKETLVKKFKIDKRIAEGADVQKANEYLVGIANRIALSGSAEGTNTLFGLAISNGSLALPTKGTKQVDLTKVYIEMMIRLIADEEYQVFLSDIANLTIYGDIEKVSRDLLIEKGLDPIEHKEQLKELVVTTLNEYTKSGDITPKYEGVFINTAPPDDIKIVAQKIASEIIEQFGLKAGKTNEYELIDSPDGRQYIMSKEVAEEAVQFQDDVAPLGKAKDDTISSFYDFKEKKQNLSRLRYALNQSETIKDYLIDQLMLNGMSKDDASVLAPLFMTEQNPEFKLKETIEELDYKYDEIYKELSEGFDVATKKRMLEEVTKRKGEEKKNIFGSKTPMSDIEQHRFFLNAKYDIIEAKTMETYLKDLPPDEMKKLYLNEKLEYKRTSPEFVTQAHYFANSVWRWKGLTGWKDGGWKEMAGFRLIKGFNTSKKIGVTTGILVPTLAYYFNNFFGAFFQAYNAGGLESISSMFAIVFKNPIIFSQTLFEMYGETGTSLSKRIMITKYGNAYSPQQLSRMMSQYGVGSSFIKAELASTISKDLRENNPKKFFSLTPSAWQNQLAEMATFSDNIFRLSTFMDQLDQGKTASQAAKYTRDAFFDYASLTPFEKNILRQIFLFYAFMRKNQVQVFRTIRDDPQRVINQIKFIEGMQERALEDSERDYLREYEKTRLMTRKGPVAWNSDDERNYLSDRFGSHVTIWPMIGTFDGLAIITPLLNSLLSGVGASNTVDSWDETKQLAKFFGGQLSPAFKWMPEVLMGEQLFGERAYEYIGVSASQVQAINAITNSTPIGNIFDPPDGMGEGMISIEPDFSPYNSNNTRLPETTYKFSTPTDLGKYLLFLEFATTIPIVRGVGNQLVGRPGRNNLILLDYANAHLTGGTVIKPPGNTFEDQMLTYIGLKSKVMPTTEEQKREFSNRFLKDLNKKISKDTSLQEK